MVAGPELAVAASQAWSQKVTFQSISAEDGEALLDDVPSEVMDDSEKKAVLGYYGLVRKGATNC
jgi:hypothetical protein